ncbi:MAG: hypothetical protein Q4B26_05440 [Eubacteriales bacterium]|nr:hypothetical protein [Eubacteriales bacterium]
MNAYQKVRAACNECGIYYAGDTVYTGKEKTYVVANVFDERVRLSADDEVQETSMGMYVHLFMPHDQGFIKIRRKLQDALVKYGLNYPEIVNNSIEGNTRHLTLQTADEEGEDN